MIPNELKSMKPMQGKERLGAHRDSEYLGAEDIEPGTEPVLTIAGLYNGMITLARGKENHDVISFVEESVPGSINTVRPLVVNSTNRKTLRKLYRSVNAETLVGKKIQLFLQPGVRDPSTGDKVDGIRIRERVPSVKSDGTTGVKAKEYKCAECGNVITGVGSFTPETLAVRSREKYGKALCVECGKKYAAAAAEPKKPEPAPADDPADELLREAME